MNLQKSSVWIYSLIGFYLFSAVFTICYFDGTGNSGDSVLHFLYAKYACTPPENFFNHWAKPLYVLLASPFAQLGFTGIKIFNSLITFFTLIYTYKVAVSLGYKNSVIVVLLMLFTPLYYVSTYTGLTEPLFALIQILALFFLLNKKAVLACILISFLPFVRSEGLIIMGVFGLYFLLKKQWKYLPLLLVGHVIYSIAGYFIYQDILWVFNKIPYATMSSIYGEGHLGHFFEQLIYVLGIPVYLLLWLGVLAVLWKLYKNQLSKEEGIIVSLGFVFFFVFHTLFWYLGIFGSMGLNRVFIAVIPLIALLSLAGFNFLTGLSNYLLKKYNWIFISLILAYIVVFPFTSNPAAIDWKNDMMKTEEEKVADSVAEYIQESFPDVKTFVYVHPYFGLALDIDHFDNEKHLNLRMDVVDHLESGDLIIWDDWFAVVDNGVSRQMLDRREDLKLVKEFYGSKSERPLLYVVYQKQ